MSHTTTEQSESIHGGKLGLELLEMIPCAAYAVKNDEDLTLIAGNKPFYQLFGCTEEEVRCKYGNRVGALFDAESLKAIDDFAKKWESNENASLDVKQRLQKNGADIWIHTKIRGFRCKNRPVFGCVSFDVTSYENERKAFAQYDEVMQFIVKQVCLDSFEYNLKTKEARVYHSYLVLPETLPMQETIVPNFVKKMVADGSVCKGFEKEFQKAFRSLAKGEEKAVCELRMKSRRNAAIWVRMTLEKKRIGHGFDVVGILEDITEQKEATRGYLNETQFYQAMLSEKDAYAQVDVTEDRITRIGGMWNLYNEIIDKVTYSALIEEFIHKIVHPEDRKHYLELMRCSNFIESLDNGIDRLGCEFRRIVEQNKMMWMQISVHLFRNPLTRHVQALLYLKNIDNIKKLEMQLKRETLFDQLTNLYNRKAAENAIREYLRRSDKEKPCAFMIIDIDHFRLMNDTYGHQAGDEVLMRLADILERTFDKNDIVGRFGGNEFMVFLKDFPSREWLRERLEALYGQIGREREPMHFSCCTGVTQSCGGSAYEQMLRQADVALAVAKSTGKGSIHFYDEETDNEQYANWHIAAEEGPRQRANDFVLAGPDAVESDEVTFDSFVAEQGDMAYLVDPDTFDLICGNKAFYDRIGMTKEQCVGMKCYETIQKRDTPCPFCSKANWATDKFYIWKNMNMALEQEFLIKNKLVEWRGREVLLALAVDISNDKSIVDSLENGAMESHSTLSGVQRMAEAETLADAMESALETIGYFFRADAVRLWRRDKEAEAYTCAYAWSRGEGSDEPDGALEVSAWLNGRKWDQQIILETPESMLGYSYEMYQYMGTHHIRNQRWIQVKDNQDELGCIEIDNISSNFQNVAFLESFSLFIGSELKKRGLMEGMLYADNHDDLTGLLSRRNFEEYVACYKPDEVSCAGVIVANFNNLKGINSIKGFQTGNYYIRQFADMLRETFGEERIFRLNGDEFLVIVTDLQREFFEEKIGELENLVQDNGYFSVSIGHSWDDVENDLGTLIEQATQMMQLNKKRHYDSAPASGDAERRKMLSDLVASLENHEFEVYLQPKVELLHNNVIGAEALIRYQNKDVGLMLPSQFIHVLEKNNMIRYIDLFVLEEICRLLQKWKRKGAFLPVISLNFSRLTLLERDILSSVEAIVSRYDVSKKNIEIEITESVANMGKSMLHQVAGDLYRAGFAIALDDFGTKYTNLSILADLDFSMLKLDKSLIGGIENRTNHQLILKNIISMCKDLGIAVIAEGVETETQQEILRELQCQMGQGYLYGRPMPIAQFEERYIKV